MAFEAKVVPFQVAASTTTGTLDITSAGFGMPMAVMVILSGSPNSSVNVVNNELLSIGMSDGTTSLCTCPFAEGGQSTTDTTRTMRNDGTIIVEPDSAGGTSTDGEMTFNSFVTDGVRLNYVAGKGFTQAFRGYVVLFKGAMDVDVSQLQHDTLVSNNHVVGFKPDLLIGCTTAAATNGTSTNAYWSFGVACREPGDTTGQWALGRTNADAQSSVGVSMDIDDAKFVGGPQPGSWNRVLAVTGWNTDGFTTTRTGSSFSTDFQCMSMRLPANQQALCGTDWSPNAIGDKVFTTNYAAGEDNSNMVFVAHSRKNPTVGWESNQNANTVSLGVADASLTQAVGDISDDQGAATSKSASAYLNGDIALVHEDGTDDVVQVRASLTSMTGGSFTLNYSAAHSLVRQFGWLSVQAGAPPAGPELDAEPGSYAYSGQDATFTLGKVLEADPGAYPYSGQDVTFQKGTQLDAEPGTYPYAGTDATFVLGKVLEAEPGAYAYTGFDAALTEGEQINAEPGAYAYAGQDATFLLGFVLDAEPGSYAYAGQDANLVIGEQLSAEPGVYSYTGQDATFLLSRVLLAEPGAYAYTGLDASLTEGETLNAEPGAYAYAGQDATFSRDRVLIAEPGAYPYVGFEAALYLTTGVASVVDTRVGIVHLEQIDVGLIHTEDVRAGLVHTEDVRIGKLP